VGVSRNDKNKTYASRGIGLLFGFSSAPLRRSETQDPRLAPFMRTHEQAPLHSWVALQRPLQTPIALWASATAALKPFRRKERRHDYCQQCGFDLLLKVALLTVPG
jgi:hypothetical protein